MDKISRIKELIMTLNDASRAYYMEDHEIMGNFEYDKLYDELVSLEQETGIIMSNSPTQKVGYEVVSSLPKEAHPSPMLSLDKTKEVDALIDWLGDKEGVLSWKMDGLTVVLTYEDGVLTKAVTRGNGEIGEVITANARVFENIPSVINYKKRLVVRGEAIIRYSDFERINSSIDDEAEKYKNPRNLCSGSVRQLSSRVTAERHVHFFAFSLAEPDDMGYFDESFRFLESLGFTVVEYKNVTAGTLRDTVKYFSDSIKDNDFPSDGLVLSFNDIAYGKSLGRTAKFPRSSIAFKWQDEEAETVLRSVEWSASRTGLINPVAVFDPVELEGTTVTRASVHNISIVRELKLGIGDRIKVYKANMIIPQISENLTGSGSLPIPDVCPVCGMKTEIRKDKDSESLYCMNPDCPAKHIKHFSHFTERNAMNIDGISDAILERLTDLGILRSFKDIYHISEHREKIIGLDGFGEKSYDNMVKSIEKSRHSGMANFIYALGIPNIGFTTARLICEHFGHDPERIITAGRQEIAEIDGIGDVIAGSFTDYFSDEDRLSETRSLMEEMDFVIPEKSEERDLEGLIFVITGSLNGYSNRDELKRKIEQRGGKVQGSVSSKTSYLINNDPLSASSKNKKARSLGIPVISEQDFEEHKFS